ncbi:MAG: hypothetical protein ACOYMN_17110 [Roseimicrobium sp.]
MPTSLRAGYFDDYGEINEGDPPTTRRVAVPLISWMEVGLRALDGQAYLQDVALRYVVLKKQKSARDYVSNYTVSVLGTAELKLPAGSASGTASFTATVGQEGAGVSVRSVDGQQVLALEPPCQSGMDVRIHLTPIDLAIDANRDGTIAKGENASQSKPLRFWINNDSDSGQIDKEDEGSTPDYQDGSITNIRDLEDFQMLKLDIHADIFYKVRMNEAQLGFKWKNVSGSGQPAVKIYRVAKQINVLKDYLWNYAKATSQLQSSHYASSIATVDVGSTAWLPANALVPEASTNQHPYLLFEGAAAGKGQLCLMVKIWNTETEGPGVWLNLLDVQEMFEKARGTPSKPYPNPPIYTQEPPRPVTGKEVFTWPGHQPFVEDPDETDEAIIMVHGWYMADADKRTFSNSFFKRLWWKGFKGKFCAFSWPTYENADDVNTHIPDDDLHYIPTHYNQSEYVAWKYGPALKTYVENISKGSKHVAAHSMGNVVMASALKAGLSVSSYVAMQAAIPATCYDSRDAANSYLPFLRAEAKQRTPDTARFGLGYRGEMDGITGNFHNFYSANDFALKTGEIVKFGVELQANWEANQIDHKPNRLLGYNHYPKASRTAKNRLEFAAEDGRITRYVTDHHEVMSFIARPRSEALGAKATLGLTNFDLSDTSLRYPFTRDRTEHSAQYQRPIQKTHKFFSMLLQKMNVGFNSLTDTQVGDISQ